MSSFIPIYEPYFTGKEKVYVMDAVKSGWISSIGEYIKKFESAFAGYCTVKYGVAATNGTAALHLALRSLGVKAGDEVIIPNVTFVATANAITYCNAKAVLVDIDENSWNIDPQKIGKKISSRTKGIIAVHLYGQPADMSPIKEIAEKHGLFVLEDAAEAHGAKYYNKKIGSLGDAAAFSFYGNKVITTGEGGMVVSNNAELDAKLRLYRDHGHLPHKRYWHEVIGYNYRMTNLNAAIGLAQLEAIETILKEKKRLVKAYDDAFANHPNIVLQENLGGREKVCWLYTILLQKSKISRDELAIKLKKQGIDSRPFFYPLSDMPSHKSNDNFSISKKIAYSGISLPSSPRLQNESINWIAETVKKILQ